jgi:hypothetical protein
MAEDLKWRYPAHPDEMAVVLRGMMAAKRLALREGGQAAPHHPAAPAAVPGRGALAVTMNY